jgi:DNA-binding NarL/FixJ family response regulator
VKRGRLLVAVDASGSLRSRIVAALGASEVSIIPTDADVPTDVSVVAVDLSRPIALRALGESLRGRGTTPVVAVSPVCGPLGPRRAVRAGVHSLVLEDEIDEALLPAVRAVAAGLRVLPEAVQDGIDRVVFSHRERQVLRLAIQGSSNSEIAAALFLAESTVKTHLSSAYRKLGAVGRKDAASLILDPDEGLVDMILGREASRPPSERVHPVPG